MNMRPELLVLGVILIFAGIVLTMIRETRKARVNKTLRAQKLGFEPLELTPLDFLSRIEDLYQNERNKTLEIRGLFHRKDLERDYYLFDLVDTDDEDTWLGTEMFGVISRNLALPRFSLTTIPAFDRQKTIGSLMDKMLDKVMDLAAKYQDLNRIEFPENPGLDEKIVVFGRDEIAVGNLLSGISLNFFTRSKTPLQLYGSGDCLIVDGSFTVTSKNQEMNLENLFQLMKDLVRAFEGSS
ncbi:MAG: hypothetical protein WBB69_10660 [Anaerolineales bacterium]